MRLIHFQGMNCYVSCLVSAAAIMGVEDPVCFASLWSETDFIDDRRHAVYTSRRIFTNLEALGCKLTSFADEAQIAFERELAALRDGDYAVIGMDAFHLPWSPVYHAVHDPHYFIAVKAEPGALICFDPTYDQAGMRIAECEVVAHGYDFVRAERCAPGLLRVGIGQEALAILRKHPNMRKDLLKRIMGCANERQHAAMLARYIAALMNNRYLFWHYAGQTPAASVCRMLFHDAYFSRWEAIKNGLYKASLIPRNQDTIEEVCEALMLALDEEAACARALVGAECGAIPP